MHKGLPVRGGSGKGEGVVDETHPEGRVLTRRSNSVTEEMGAEKLEWAVGVRGKRYVDVPILKGLQCPAELETE